MNHNRIQRHHIKWAQQENLADGEARSATTSAPSAPEERDHFFRASPKFAVGCSSSFSRGMTLLDVCGFEALQLAASVDRSAG